MNCEFLQSMDCTFLAINKSFETTIRVTIGASSNTALPAQCSNRKKFHSCERLLGFHWIIFDMFPQLKPGKKTTELHLCIFGIFDCCVKAYEGCFGCNSIFLMKSVGIMMN